MDIVTLLGPTASGKTALGVLLAEALDSEIISADSRQIYRRMDIGTGKDLGEYCVNGKKIPYHLIDICEPDYKYNLYEYQRDFNIAYAGIKERGRLPILCGGTGLYIETVLKGYAMPQVPENKELRASLADKSIEELEAILKQYKTLHNKTDIDTCKRAIRAIEIAEYYQSLPQDERHDTPLQSYIIGIDIDRELRRKRISARLKARFDAGMLDEVKALLDSGIPSEDLIYYGLEYKFMTEHILGLYNYNEMFTRLEIAIHQFAKRQMTWFRGMERRGFTIHWVDGTRPFGELCQEIIKKFKEQI